MKKLGLYQKAVLIMVFLAVSNDGIALAKTKKEIPQNRQNQKLCKKWKAGKPLQWPSDCNSVGSKKCRKLCNSQMIASEKEETLPSGLY